MIVANGIGKLKRVFVGKWYKPWTWGDYMTVVDDYKIQSIEVSPFAMTEFNGMRGIMTHNGRFYPEEVLRKAVEEYNKKIKWGGVAK